MKPWRTLLRAVAVVLAACAAAPSAWAALACTISASPAPVTGLYTAGANLDLQGSFSVTCTRDPATDPRKPEIWIGIDQGAGGRTMTRDTGGATLAYTIYRKTYGTAVWTSSGSYNQNQNANGGLVDMIDFGPGSGAVVNATYNFYYRVPSGQTSPAAVYLDTVGVTIRQGSDAGALLNSTVISSQISIQHNCRFSTVPAPIAVTYTAFQTTARTGTSSFALVCTQGTSYSLALDQTRSVVPTVNLAYSLGLSASTGTGTAQAQAFSVNISIDAGQAGACNAANCNGTDTRTITVTY